MYCFVVIVYIKSNETNVELNFQQYLGSRVVETVTGSIFYLKKDIVIV